MFTGIMNAPRYEQILEQSLLPFIQGCYPAEHRFQQDNDQKHTSAHRKLFQVKRDQLVANTPRVT